MSPGQVQGFYSGFSGSAEKWPQNVAIEVQREHSLERYTYAELRQMAESVGRWLTEANLARGARCAFLGNNSARWVAAYLGTIAAGCVAVPLDTAFKPKQIATLLKDSGATVLFADERFLPAAREAAAGMPIRFVLLEGKAAGVDAVEKMFSSGPGKFAPISPQGLEEPAVMLYTSGTTSDPKGVVLSHDNLLAEVEAVFSFVHIGPRDAILGVLPLFHALAQMANLLLPFAGGARVVYLESLNTTELLRGLRERDITLFCCVPQFFYLIHERILKDVAGRGPLARGAFRTLLSVSGALRKLRINPGKLLFRRAHVALGERMRYLVTGGSRFDLTVARDLYALGFDILQAYGLTEVSGGAFATPPNDNVLGSVGTPLQGVETRLFASAAAESSDNAAHVSGEIALRGRTVMRGYYNRPDANAASFRDGWFLTGDLGYFDADGNLFITGRAKEVIVLSNGKNIYPEEIEQHYLQSPWIKEMCVVGLESKPGERLEERLHAAVVPDFDVLREKRIVNINEVIRFDIETLSTKITPAKRILSYEIWKEPLPRTTTQKLRRFEILRRVESGAGQKQEERGPVAVSAGDELWMARPDVAQALATIREAAREHAGQVAPAANLELDLGLDSMERVELMVALEQAFDAAIPEERVAELYTVRELVEAVLEHSGKGAPERKQQPAGWEHILSVESQLGERGASAVSRERSARGDAAEPSARREASSVAATLEEKAVRAITRPQFLYTLFWFAAGRLVNLFTRDFFDLKITGVEKLPLHGPYIISPNHQSFIDAPVLVAFFPWQLYKQLFYVGTSEIFGSGFGRWLARTMKLIPVDPDANLVPAMRAGAYGLRHGRVLVLYPEGERSITGEPKAFKKGAAILATHLQVPIYPVAMDGFFEAWPRGKNWFQRFSRMRIAIGDPVLPPATPGPSPEQTYAQLTAELKHRVVEMWDPMHAALNARLKAK
ncbi:MAG: AMP-binding protein [Candidatus Koribacter versatilis]|uniref:AMP-binding protein n=1 Tax=Candidatus Korobacter versatilis TaxID=658062 RepID=A0A932A5X9_9BACT|nr:AMP-binding protein [Candidatus Koribacter versatilis]